MARSFNGSSDVITASSTNLRIQAPLTIWFWFWVNDLGGVYQTCSVWTNNDGTNSWWQVQVNAGGTLFFIKDANSGNQSAIGAPGSYTANSWNNMFCYWDGTTQSTSLNGAAPTTATPGYTSIGQGTPQFTAGASNNLGGGFTQFLPGRIADFAFWNVTLTAIEQSALTRGIRPSAIRPASLVRWFPFGGLQSPEPDLSGKAFNGTLTGTAPAFGPPITAFTPRWHRVPPLTAPAFTLMPQIVT